jgi:5-methylcytosine-specific restriction endonuclease McrA
VICIEIQSIIFVIALNVGTFQPNNIIYSSLVRCVKLSDNLRHTLQGEILNSNSMSYQSQLLNKEWKLKRLEIIERDNNECQVCMSADKLEVHHKKYLPNIKAWEYENKYLITLCKSCHFIYEYDKNPNLLDKVNRWDKDDLDSFMNVCDDPIIRNKKQSVKLFTYNLQDMFNVSHFTASLFLYIAFNLRYQRTYVVLNPKDFLISKTTFYRTINELIEIGVIEKTEQPKIFKVSKKYLYNGKSE